MMVKVKSVEETYVYKTLNQNDNVSKRVLGIMQKGIPVSKTNLEEAFMVINKNFKYAAKNAVLNAVNNGDIYMYYAPDNMKLPVAMPFFLTMAANNKIVAIVMVDIYGVRDKDTGDVKIDPKKLYTLLESAYFARLYHIRHSSFVGKTSVISDGSKIYSHMFARVLNKKYALNLDKTKFNTVIYLASKFYMINMLGMHDSDTVKNYAFKNCMGANPSVIEQLEDNLHPEVYKDLTTFIQFLAGDLSGLKYGDLTVRGYLEQYITMYESSALLALEYLPFFVYNVVAVSNGSFINNQYLLEDIVDRNGAKLYNEISSLHD